LDGDFPELDEFCSKFFNGQALILRHSNVELFREYRYHTSQIGGRVILIDALDRIGAKLTPMGEQVIVKVRPQGLAGLPHFSR